ncbi:MAG TPA: hypothetical protein VF817_01650 [Patescibacteria group bacterium]
MTKETQFDELARMINNGFEEARQDNAKIFKEINKRFDDIDDRFGSMDRKFVDVTERLDRIEDRLDNVAYNFDVKSLNKRVTKIENLLKTKGLPGFAKNH